jgi:hypothetical protein
LHFNLETAYRITHVEPRNHYRLLIEFEDGVKGEVNLSNQLFGPMFEPLKDPAFFSQVKIDEFGAIYWPNQADLAPDALYHTIIKQ